MSEPRRLSEDELRSRRAKAETMVLKCISIDSRPAGSDTLPLLDHIEAQAEDIRRLREALEPFADAHRNHTRINWDDEECRRAAKAMEPQTKGDG